MSGSLLEVILLILTIMLTVSVLGLFSLFYLLLRRVTSIPIDFKIPMVETTGGGIRLDSPDPRDQYTPDSADKSVSLDQFTPDFKKPLKLKIREEDGQSIMEEVNES